MLGQPPGGRQDHRDRRPLHGGCGRGTCLLRAAGCPELRPGAFGGWGGDETTGYPYENGVTFSRADNYGFHDFEGYPENKDVGELNTYVAGIKKKQSVRFTLSGYGLSGTTPTPTSFRERLIADPNRVDAG